MSNYYNPPSGYYPFVCGYYGFRTPFGGVHKGGEKAGPEPTRYEGYRDRKDAIAWLRNNKESLLQSFLLIADRDTGATRVVRIKFKKNGESK